ncbi:hypothetical protein [Mogibacterium kristiansenii]|uniref:hypothetical protein n=1 Tax=Mogibacterium kristiansenii TaxID=2606708 RepID=UPI0012B2140A|nr:hypothetical protein [Mogibacterium kristiansenii]
MKEPASGKQSQLDDEIAFRMQVCSFVKIPEKKVKNQLKSREIIPACCYLRNFPPLQFNLARSMHILTGA